MMTERPGEILVLGATGRQGGAVARELTRRGWRIRALVRDTDSPAAREIAALGAHVVRGDLDDPASIEAAMRRAYGVFSVQTFASPAGAAGEVRQGRSVADVASRVGVRHLVYSSVGGADRAVQVAHFASKAQIERHVAALGVPATVLRPAMFIDNFAAYGPELVDGTLVLALALSPDTRVQMIAVGDIARLAADAFDDPAGWLGQCLEIAGDALTGPEMAAAFGAAAGLPARFEEVPLDALRSANAEAAAMFDWMNREGYRADLTALRQRYPALTTLASWIAAGGWTVPA